MGIIVNNVKSAFIIPVPNETGSFQKTVEEAGRNGKIILGSPYSCPARCRHLTDIQRIREKTFIPALTSTPGRDQGHSLFDTGHQPTL